MEHRFLRTEMVLGDRALEKLSRCHVAVFGLGGVGSYAAEILARSGVGELTLVDQDTLSLTNITRQLSEDGVNVPNMTNKSKGDYAYTIVDVDSPVTDEAIADLKAIPGIIRMRLI